MELIPVSSNNLSAVGYDEATKDLTVVYKGSGRSDTFGNVSMMDYSAMVAAPSVGSYFERVIKVKYGRK